MKKTILTFVITLILGHFLFQEVGKQIQEHQVSQDQVEIEIIQQEIIDRFDLFLGIPFTIGRMTSEFFKLYPKESKDKYDDLVKHVLESRKDILGLNLLDKDGVIIRTYPEDSNAKALGKKSQNFEALLHSFNQAEEYWFSPPFKLFQGETGFVFYIPIVKDNKIEGWIAPVISSNRFFESFRKLKFFETYELSIKDKETNFPYFETAISTDKVTPVLSAKGDLAGRTINFYSWRKEEKQADFFAWYWSLPLSFLMAILAAMGMWFYQQKQQSASQLESIGQILRLTAKEGLTQLVDIQSEYLKQGTTGYLKTSVVEKDIQSITNLIEQIDLLQTMAASEDQKTERFEVSPLINEQVEDLRDIAEKLEINLMTSFTSLKGITIDGNPWILSHCILRNSLAHCLLLSKRHSTIHITAEILQRMARITFHAREVHQDSVSSDLRLDRKIMVAKNAMELFEGKMDLKTDEAQGLTIGIQLKTT